MFELDDNNPVEAGVGGGAAGPLAGVEKALRLGLPVPEEPSLALTSIPPGPDIDVEDAGVRGGVSGV